MILKPPNPDPSLYRPTTKEQDARLYLDFLLSCPGADQGGHEDLVVIEYWIWHFRKALDERKSSLPDPYPGHVLSRGATALHILACMVTTNNGHDETIFDWLDKVGAERVRAMGAQLDCSGRTPFGIALAADLNVTMGYCAGEYGGALRALAARGVVGAPGEVGSILLESMEQQGSKLNGTSALRLLPLHKVIAACSRHGVDWLVPLTTSSGVIEDRDEAMGVLLEKFGAIAMKPEIRAGFEALFLSEEIQKVDKSSAAIKRL